MDILSLFVRLTTFARYLKKFGEDGKYPVIKDVGIGARGVLKRK